MIKYIIVVLVLIFAALAFMYVTTNSPSVYQETISFAVNPHIYNNPDRSIKDIKIVVFYFIPKDRITLQVADWKEILESRLKELASFHLLQLRGTSRIHYDIYPEPVIGFKEAAQYDTNITEGGNPQALLHVAKEIDTRVFDPAGDLYRQDFSITRKDGYPVLLILYEGVGASGGIIYDSESGSVSEVAQKLGLSESIIHPVEIKTVDGFLLLNRKYITDKQDVGAGTTILAHEFYHTLGVPDGYEEIEEDGIQTAVSTSNDIMGIGRIYPIDKAYLSSEFLKGLGL